MKKFHLTVDCFLPVEKGDRVLSCGEGEQLGHPGRTTTRKPRAIDTLPSEKLVVQVSDVSICLCFQFLGMFRA